MGERGVTCLSGRQWGVLGPANESSKCVERRCEPETLATSVGISALPGSTRISHGVWLAVVSSPGQTSDQAPVSPR